MPAPAATPAEPTPGRTAAAIWLLLVLAPILLHWPDLTGWLSENPAYVLSGLATGPGAGSGVLTGYPGWIDGNAGVTTQALGGLAARDWLHGVVPWWNPYAGVGLPLAAEMQNSAFFLPFTLLLACLHGVVYLKISLQIVAGLACFALLRELRLSRATAVTVAVCFQVNGSFAWFAHGPIMPIAFLPLLLFGIERARTAPWQGAFCTGAAIGWSLLAGFPETAYLDSLLGLAWTVLRLVQDRRAAPAAAIVAGGCAGLMLAAPPLLAFLQSLPISFLSDHTQGEGGTLPAANRAMLLFPYLYGPPMYGGLRLIGAPSLQQFLHWFRTAGYLDLPLLCAASLAPRRRGAAVPHHALRWLLAGYCIAGLGRAVGLPVVSSVVDALPLLRHSMAQLYLIPSCQMAILILAALAIDDWRMARLPRRPALRLLAGAGGLTLSTLPGAAPMIRQLAHIPQYAWYPLLSVLAAAIAVTTLAALIARPATAASRNLLNALLACHAALLFFLPLLCGTPRPRGLDTAAIAALQAQPGPTRVHGVGRLNPNYGAWFGIAQIDDNALPVPQAWVDDVRATLLPGTDGINNFSSDASPSGIAALQARLPALAAHGVTTLLLPPGVTFEASVTLPVASDGNVAHPLVAPFTGTIPAGRVTPGRLTGLTVMIGTYAGAARGQLSVTLCQADHCTHGQATLAGATDNADLTLPLTPALDLTSGQAITYRFDPSASPAHPPALWLWPQQSGMAPRLSLRYAPAPGSPQRIYADPTVALWRIAGAPYLQAPGCRLTIASRTRLTADCPAPARLLRRELAYPGWQARRDGQPVPITPAGIFQTVPLPVGHSTWLFSYAPPHATPAWLACATAVLALGWLGSRRKQGQVGAVPSWKA